MARGVSVVGRYYLYQATATFGFISPIFTLFMLARDLSYAEIASLSALVAAVTVVGEMPTGYVSDRIGRRDGLVAATGLLCVSLAGFVVARTYAAFVALYVLWAIGLTFRSGSESAWLYDILDERSESRPFTHVRGRGEAIRQGTGVVAMITGSVLYVVEPTAPFVAALVLNALGIPALLAMPRNRRYDDGDEDRDEDGSLKVVRALPVLRDALARPPLRAFVLYVGLLFAAVGATNTYVQPITVDVLEARIGAVRVAGESVPPAAALGVIYAGFTAVSAGASAVAGDVEAAVGLRTALAVVPVAIGLLLVVPVAVPALAIPAFFAMRAGRRLVEPMVKRRLNDDVGSAGRATVLSAASMAWSALSVPLVLVGGVVADGFGPLVAVAGFGAVFLVGAGLLALVETPLATGETSDETGRSVS